MSSNEEGLALVPGYQLSFRGSISALDLETGAVVWTTFTVPVGYTGGAVWGSNFAVDIKRESLYVTTGNNYSVPSDVSACLKNATTVAAEFACLSPVDYIDGVLSLSLKDGHVKWSRRLEGADTWTVSCFLKPNAGIPCPDPSGPDFDFGSGPNFFTIAKGRHRIDVVGAGQKSGVYWALNAKNGDVLWATQVGPGGLFGGIQWGSATDGNRIYTAIGNFAHNPYTLAPSHTVTVTGGSWAALDPVNGKILWQIPATGQDSLHPDFPAIAIGPVSVANGVVYAGSMSGDMVAISARSGRILWKFASGGAVASGPSIVDGTVYWGSGYTTLRQGTGNNKVFAFTIQSEDKDN
jgi:polyvinyl alcohol dehydrogenase (cytochrome)